MTQATNPSIATGQTGTAYRTQDNDRYAAALTQHSGSSRPTYAVAGTLWLDTTGTPWILKMYDGADDISVGTVNASTNAFNASNAASTSSTIAMTAAINEAGATVASASTCDIGAAAGNYVSVTGVTTITALGTVQVGTRRTVRFAGILTLTHNGTSLILPGAANITTATGDVASFISLGSGNWFCTSYLRAASAISALITGTAANNIVQLDGSAKIPAVDGTQLTGIGLQGLQTVWVPAGAMVPRTTNGAASGTSESTTNKVMTKSLDFDTATQEFAQFNVRFPKSWNEGTVTFAPVWTATSGSGGVVFGLAGVALSDDDAIDTAYGTAQTSTDTLITANDIHVGPTSSAITIAGTSAVGDWVSFQINRTVSNGSDTLGVDARLLGIVLLFTTDAGNDA